MSFARTARRLDEHKLLMAFWLPLHPNYFRQAWRALDEEAMAERTNPAAANFRAAVTLLTAALCLLLIHSLKVTTTFEAVLEWLSRADGRESGVGYVLLPVLVIKTLLRDRVSAYGLRLGSLARHFHGYVLLAAPIICFALPDIVQGNRAPCGSFPTASTGYLMMHKRHQKTYADLYAGPIKRNIRWDDIVSLIEALGGQVIHNEGSRRRFDLNGISLNIHSPYPQKEIKCSQVKAIREFLQLAGVKL